MGRIVKVSISCYFFLFSWFFLRGQEGIEPKMPHTVVQRPLTIPYRFYTEYQELLGRERTEKPIPLKMPYLLNTLRRQGVTYTLRDQTTPQFKEVIPTAMITFACSLFLQPPAIVGHLPRFTIAEGEIKDDTAGVYILSENLIVLSKHIASYAPLQKLHLLLHEMGHAYQRQFRSTSSEAVMENHADRLVCFKIACPTCIAFLRYGCDERHSHQGYFTKQEFLMMEYFFAHQGRYCQEHRPHWM